jgi:protein involved in polysaccharide export with SLBB domain
MQPILFALLALTTFALSACGYRAVRETPIDEFVSRSKQLDAAGYTVQVGDVLTVKFYFNPELDFDVPVRADGKISLSLIGDVAASGYTTQDLSSAITTAYRTYLNQPNATVILKSPSGHRVFVTGEVNIPGLVTLQGTETVLSVVSEAGGLSDRASWNKVVLIRHLPDGAQPMVATLDLRKALTGGDPRQDVKVCMNDILYVPRTGAAESNVVLKNLIWNKAPFSMYGSANWNGTLNNK